MNILKLKKKKVISIIVELHKQQLLLRRTKTSKKSMNETIFCHYCIIIIKCTQTF